MRAEITTTELGQTRAELATATGRAERLTARSRSDGAFAVMKPQDLPGRFLREGQQIGYVLPAGSRIVRATIRQDDIDLVRHRLRSTVVKLAERLDATLPAEIIREVPAGRDDLPSKALGGTGGGALAVDPGDPHGTKTLQRVFQLDIVLPENATAAAAFGSRAYVRFNHDWEPAGQQIWRRVRQLLCPSYRSKVIRMLLSRHRRQIIDAGSFAADAPYAEQAARKEGRLDGALLSAWGRVSPYLLSALTRDRLKRFAGRARIGTAARKPAGPAFARACG